jgi:aromatic-amino-acid transaminase
MEHPMPFGHLETLTPDPVLAITGRFRADPRAWKMDLGVGVYRNSAGQTPVFEAVKQAETLLAREQSSKSYLGSDGDPDFVRRMAAEACTWNAVAGLQTVGGTGALRLAAELLALTKPGRRIWMGVPTWPNHLPIFTAAVLDVAPVPLLDRATQRHRPGVILDALRDADPGDAVLLHGCCHNPTGIDPDLSFWTDAARIITARGLVPLVDMAYQGLGQDWTEDGLGLRCLAERVPHLLVAYSCDKNFGLYRERVGALWVSGSTPAQTRVLVSHLTALARANYSMPPDHGAAVVRVILENAPLRQAWRAELSGMRTRVRGLRTALAAHGRIGAVDLSDLATGNGMFAMLPLSVAQIDLLQTDHAIYMAHSGRINIAGLAEHQIDRFVAALGAVQIKNAA